MREEIMRRIPPYTHHHITFPEKFNRIFFTELRLYVCIALRIRCSMMRSRIMRSTAPTTIPPISPAQ